MAILQRSSNISFVQMLFFFTQQINRTGNIKVPRIINTLCLDIITTQNMIVITFLLLWLANNQVNHLPIVPKVQRVTFTQSVQTVPSATAFSKKFPGMGYEIGGAIYETNKELSKDQIHNPLYYNKSTSCQFYNSKLKLGVINEIQLTIGINIQSLTISQKSQDIYYLQSNDSYSDEAITPQRLLTGASYNDKGINTTSRNISISSFGLNSSEKLDVMLVAVGDFLIITDGVKIIAVEAKNFSNFNELKLDSSQSSIYSYDFAAENDLLHLKVCHYDQKTNVAIIQATWNKAIRIYKISQKFTKVVLETQLLPPNGTEFTDAVQDHGRYWALAQGKFIAYRQSKAGKFLSAVVELQSKQCFGLNKFQTTVHIICRQQGLNYVGQYFLNESFVKPEQALFLNRYYVEIDDAKTLFRFGGDLNPKLIISGDYDLQIVPYAVNRQAIIESANLPRAQRLKSLGVQEIYSIANYSNSSTTTAIGVGQSYLTMFQITEEPPQIECTLLKTAQNSIWSILVEINSSSCIANGDWEQLQSICTYQIPYALQASLVQVDATKHTTVVVTVLMLLLAVAILLIGLALCCKSNLKKAGSELKKKLAALKKQKELKPI